MVGGDGRRPTGRSQTNKDHFPIIIMTDRMIVGVDEVSVDRSVSSPNRTKPETPIQEESGSGRVLLKKPRERYYVPAPESWTYLMGGLFDHISIGNK